MVSLLSEFSSNLANSHVMKSAEQVYFGNKTIYANIITKSYIPNPPSEPALNSKLKATIDAAKRVIDDALALNSVIDFNDDACSSSELDSVRSDIAALKLENQELRKSIDEMREILKKINISGATNISDAKTIKADDENFDLFGSESEDEKETEEKIRIREQTLAAYAAKKSKKPGPIAKSSVILDVKPWDDETDLKEMEKHVRSITLDGLHWGASKFIPIGYGIQKVQIVCTIEDEKVSVDADLIDYIQETFSDYVQSVDIVAFNKI